MRWLVIIGSVVLAGCAVSDKAPPASDVSGAGFVMLSPNAAARQFIIANDRQFAEQVVVNREACRKAVLCRK